MLISERALRRLGSIIERAAGQGLCADERECTRCGEDVQMDEAGRPFAGTLLVSDDGELEIVVCASCVKELKV